MNKSLVKRTDSIFNDLNPVGLRTTFDNFIDEIISDRNRLWNVFDSKSKFPKTNIIENEDGLVFDIALPGYKKEDIEITYTSNTLKVKASNITKNEEKDKYHLREVRSSSFERSWKLDDIFDEEKMNASMEDGLLNISVPYSEKFLEENIPKVKKISIS